MPKSILLVDDHEIVRRGIRATLSPHWEICGEASDGKEAIEKVLALKPDLILMDISMPTMNGLDATREIRKLGIRTPVIILSMHDLSQFSKHVKAAGADAFLCKTSPAKDLLAMIATLLGEIS